MMHYDNPALAEIAKAKQEEIIPAVATGQQPRESTSPLATTPTTSKYWDIFYIIQELLIIEVGTAQPLPTINNKAHRRAQKIYEKCCEDI